MTAQTSVEWLISEELVGYAKAVAHMEARVGAIARGEARELVWLLQHPPLYTKGTSAMPGDLIEPDRFPVHQTGRGGQYTYHGPGQRIAYVMLDLNHRGRDVRAFVRGLEAWMIETLAAFGVKGEVRPGRVGVWVARAAPAAGRDDKIAAIGIRVRRWVSFHGISLNVAPDLDHYSGIVPCGVHDHGVTSLADLGCGASMTDVDSVLRTTFEAHFGSTETSTLLASA